MPNKLRMSVYETDEAKESQLFKDFKLLAKKRRRSINFSMLDAMQEYIDNHQEVEHE